MQANFATPVTRLTIGQVATVMESPAAAAPCSAAGAPPPGGGA
jgi:hypothetical protein